MQYIKIALIALAVGVAVNIMGFMLHGTGTVTTVVKQALGGAGPDISSPYFSYGDVKHWAGRVSSLTQASTTACMIASPAATSTLDYASVYFDVVSTTTATVITMAQSALGSSASTTLIDSQSVASNAKAFLSVGSTTQFAPNTQIIVTVKGIANGLVYPTGICQAGWTAIQ